MQESTKRNIEDNHISLKEPLQCKINTKRIRRNLVVKKEKDMRYSKASKLAKKEATSPSHPSPLFGATYEFLKLQSNT